MAEFGLTARQFNAARFTLEGMERSYRERLVQLVAEDRVRLVSLKRRRTKSEKPFARHHLARRIARIEHRIALREDDAARGSVRIAFGSRKLWRAQHALEANDYDSHEAWRNAWRDARSSQFFVLGSKDETAGCQGCAMTHLGDGHFSLRLRLPNAAVEKYATCEVRFRYGWEHLVFALGANQAISYRFLRDAKGWRVFASTLAMAVASDRDLSRGALGVDLNADHLALSQSGPDGNLVSFERIALVTYGLSKDRAAALLGDAIKGVIAAALKAKVPIVVETLDFAKKKARLREGGARYARMLSSFAYRRFVQVLCARAYDAGIAVIFVNPAYSSLIGRRKFTRRYGISTHQAAALVLARRAQRFSERPNRRDQVALRAPARKHARHVWSSWVRIAREEARDGLSGQSRRSGNYARDPSAAAAPGATIPPGAGEIPARESVARTVRAAS